MSFVIKLLYLYPVKHVLIARTMTLFKTTFIKVLFPVLLLTTLFSCAEQNGYGIAGVLKGKISIGPLCPVETTPPQPGCTPTAETYKAWAIAVWKLNKTTKVTTLSPTLDGNYRISLPSGKYIVDFDSSVTYRFGSNLPTQITILPNDTTVLDITIDTGIR
jgi:hypothetical protein